MSLIPCPTAVTPAGLLAQVRETKDLLRPANVQQLAFAVAWADSHPDPHELKPVLGPFRAFPSAERGGVDHGNTCTCNLAPLCRRHHRLKTHAGWTYAVVEPGIFVWREPHGQRFMRNHQGTYDVTPPENFQKSGQPGTWNGCREEPPDQLASQVQQKQHSAHVGCRAVRWRVERLTIANIDRDVMGAAGPDPQ